MGLIDLLVTVALGGQVWVIADAPWLRGIVDLAMRLGCPC